MRFSSVCRIYFILVPLETTDSYKYLTRLVDYPLRLIISFLEYRKQTNIKASLLQHQNFMSINSFRILLLYIFTFLSHWKGNNKIIAIVSKLIFSLKVKFIVVITYLRLFFEMDLIETNLIYHVSDLIYYTSTYRYLLALNISNALIDIHLFSCYSANT